MVFVTLRITEKAADILYKNGGSRGRGWWLSRLLESLDKEEE